MYQFDYLFWVDNRNCNSVSFYYIMQEIIKGSYGY